MDKREHLVQVAFDLFYREGVHAVGINRILTESGVAKKTLYNHFASKDELVAATLSYRDQRFLNWLGERMATGPAGIDALKAMFDALHDWFNGQDAGQPQFNGCYFINLSAEYGDAEHPLHKQCSAHKWAVQALMRQHLSVWVEAGMLDQLVDALALLKEGAIVQAHVTGDKNAALKAWAIAEPLLQAHVRRED